MKSDTAGLQTAAEHIEADDAERSGRLRVLGWVAALSVSLAVWAVVVFVGVLVFG